LPTVSVVIPAYNAERYLRETLDSVLAQTYRDFEVIVVDDGSKDSTPAIAKGYGEPVRCVEQANAGPSAARNRGIREARGAFIAFVDSDDLWLPEKLAEQVPLFDPEGRVGLVYCRAEKIGPAGQPLPTPQLPKPRGRVFMDFLFRNHCPTSGVVVRRECFETCGVFPEDMVWAEDWHLWLRIARRYEFEVVDRVLIRHRVHGGALTAQSEKAYAGARKALQSGFVEGDGAEVRAAVRRGLHRLDRNQGLLMLALGETRSARRCLWRALGNGPSDPHAAAGLVASLLPGPLRRPLMRAWKRCVPWLPWDRAGRPEGSSPAEGFTPPGG